MRRKHVFSCKSQNVFAAQIQEPRSDLCFNVRFGDLEFGWLSQHYVSAHGHTPGMEIPEENFSALQMIHDVGNAVSSPMVIFSRQAARTLSSVLLEPVDSRKY